MMINIASPNNKEELNIRVENYFRALNKIYNFVDWNMYRHNLFLDSEYFPDTRKEHGWIDINSNNWKWETKINKLYQYGTKQKSFKAIKILTSTNIKKTEGHFVLDNIKGNKIYVKAMPYPLKILMEQSFWLLTKFPKGQKKYLGQNINNKVIELYKQVKNTVSSDHWAKEENVLKLFKDEYIKEFVYKDRKERAGLIDLFEYYNL